MQLIYFLTISIFLLLLSPVSKAKAPTDAFYTVNASQVTYPELSKKLIQDMVLSVLIKITGDTKLRFNAEVQKAIKTVDSSFVNRHQIIEDQIPYQHKVALSQKHVNDLLSSLKLTKWPTPRPLTIVWLGLENSSGKRTIITDRNVLKTWKSALQKTETVRGVKFVLPILSLLEFQTIKPEQIWSGNDQFFLELSKSYNAKQSLMLVIKQQRQNWEMHWRFYGKDNVLLDKGLFYIEDINKGISILTEKIADLTWKSEGSILNQEKDFFLNIGNVNKYEDYQKVSESLSANRWFKKAFLLSVENGILHYRLTTFGSGKEYMQNLYAKNLFVWKRNNDEQKVQSESFFDSASSIHFLLKNATIVEPSP